MDIDSIDNLGNENLLELYNNFIIEGEKKSAHCACRGGYYCADCVYGYGNYYYCTSCCGSGRWLGYAYGP